MKTFLSLALLPFAVGTAPTAKKPTAAAPTGPPTPAPQYDICFEMGETMGNEFVIKAGVGQHYELPRFTELGEDGNFVFWAWTLHPINEDHCAKYNHSWFVKDIEYPSNVIGVHKQEGGGCANPIDFANSSDCAFQIDFTCDSPAPKDELVEHLKVVIGFHHFPQDIAFTVDLGCLMPEEGGWGAGSIFVFTVFILTSVVCLLGCCFNYVQLGKRGLEMVPGSAFFADCVGRVTGQSRYTPQMDYDAPIAGASADRYGASYQTDL